MACRICSGETSKILFQKQTPYLDGQYRYSMVECLGCGFVQAEGPADAHLLAEVYGGTFHDSSQQRADVLPDQLLTEAGLRFPVVRNAVERADWLQQCGFAGRLLDVGAGKGYFVKAAQRHFQAQGIEISASAVEASRSIGAQVQHGDFQSLDFGEGRFDVITLWDVLAGFREPTRVVERLSALLQPDGSLVFTVPRSTSAVALLLGRYWPLCIPPVNLSYFSERSLQVLLKQHGFEIQSVQCRGKWVTLDFLLLKLRRALGGAGTATGSARAGRSRSVRINLRDILTVVARKRQTAGAPA